MRADPRARAVRPRGVALGVLRDIERRRGFSNRMLGEALERAPGLDVGARALVTTLVYGVLRHRARLDHLIDAVADRPRGIKGELREMLRIAAFELRELERPLGIAANEATRLARRLDRSGGLTGLVTAVLAAIDARGEHIDAQADAGPPLTALEARWSIPRWLAGRWIRELGPELARARARALADPPFVDLRVDLDRITREQLAARLLERTPTARLELPADQPQCIRVRGGADLFHDPSHEAGLFSVQGLGSQQATLLLQPAPGDRVLDACAGMGGKTLHVAERMQRRGRIVALDVRAGQLRALEQLRRRARLDDASLDLSVVHGDLLDPDLVLDSPPLFDRVLLDAPCTGLGNLARHPELRWTCRYEDIASCAARQRALLHAATRWLRPGGRMVYSVCSLEPEEGRDLVASAVTEPGAGSRMRIAAEQVFTPEAHACDGMYLALLCRD